MHINNALKDPLDSTEQLYSVKFNEVAGFVGPSHRADGTRAGCNQWICNEPFTTLIGAFPVQTVG
jgi:hypothetical protein